MTRAEREALQLARLRETAAWAAARVPFYRGLAGARLASLDDLPALPFTRKTDLREQYPFGLFAVPQAEVARVHASSGTKGKPTVVGYTAADLDVWREVMARAMTAAGARRGDPLQVAFGYGLFTGGLGFHDGAERIGMTVVPTSSGNTARQCLLLRDLRPAGLCATPSFALHIAETLADQGTAPADLGLRYGMYGAEPWTEGMRRALEQGLGCPAFDVYGLSEVTGPGVSGECEARDGLHLADDHFLPEIIDPATGEVLPPGREGELVLTTLSRRAMPVVRYRTGDLTALTFEPCRCGRTSARMARIKGRSDDMLIIKGVNVYPSEVEAALLDVEELVPHYQLVVDRRETLARLEIQVEPSAALLGRTGESLAGHPATEARRQRVAARLRTALGLGVEVTLVAPRTIPRSEGKAVRVIERS
ncbi:MAG: phenylacetate--CoA ligase [Candidatus Rokubacteria bacterium]|nr:phenylacetate--CoA ligase [Candidatus Rokubacteria bacterium]